MTTPFTHKPTLVGDLVTLRPITAADADTIDRLIREDDEIPRLTGSVHSSDGPHEETPVAKLREIYGSWATAHDRLVLGVVDNASGDLVGEVVLNEWDEGNRSCGFRTLIGRAGRDRGLGTETTRLIVAHGLGPMGLHRISLEVYDFNPRARRVYEKVGFVHEGTGREALLFDGEWVDVHHMAILSGSRSAGGQEKPLPGKFPGLSPSQAYSLEGYVADIHDRFPEADDGQDVENREIATRAAADRLTGTRPLQAFGDDVRSTWRQYWRTVVAAQQAATMEVAAGADRDVVAEQTSVSASDINALLRRRSGSGWHVTEPVKPAE